MIQQQHRRVCFEINQPMKPSTVGLLWFAFTDRCKHHTSVQDPNKYSMSNILASMHNDLDSQRKSRTLLNDKKVSFLIFIERKIKIWNDIQMYIRSDIKLSYQ